MTVREKLEEMLTQNSYRDCENQKEKK